ncbi:MAG: hypothetical protein IKP62_10620 [Salinivirgaceae bacterium]|nr:hypothetical protein [Salinivirgaceae bacterium]
MKKIVFLLLAAIVTIGFSSCSKDEEKEGTFVFSLKDQNGKNIEGFILLFQGDSYDPTTYNTESMSVKTTSGKQVSISYICGTKDTSAPELTVEAGEYYAIYHYIKSEKSIFGGFPTLTNVWKGESISVKGGERKNVAFTLNLSKKNGCQN